MRNINLSERILRFIDDNRDIYTLITNPFAWGKDFPQQKNTFYKTVYRLKDEGYLEEVEENGKKRYLTTLKGKAKISRFLKKDKDWDRKWRIVIFDIPEEKKIMRNFFRRKLKGLGFRFLQESVWVSPHNSASQIEILIDLCDAKKYVHYLLVEELDNKDVLMKLFKLAGSKYTQK